MIDTAFMSFGVRLEFEISLRQPDADIGFVDMVSGDIVAYHGEEEETVVGHVRAGFIHAFDAAHAGEMYDALDALNGEYEGLFGHYFDEDGIRDEFQVGFNHDVLYIEAIELFPGFEGRHIDWAIVRRIADTFASCELVVMILEHEAEAPYWSLMGFVPAVDGAMTGYFHLNLGVRQAAVVLTDNGCFELVPHLRSVRGRDLGPEDGDTRVD